MKKAVIVILLLKFTLSFSQDTEEKGFYVGPLVSSLISQGYYDDDFGFQDYNKFFKTYYSVDVGGDFLYSFNRNLSLTFGFHYSQAGFSYEHFYTRDSVYNPRQIYKVYEKRTYGYLNLPVHMDWCILKGKVSPVIISGIMPQIFLTGNFFERTTYNNGLIQTHHGIIESGSPFSVVHQLGIGVDINFKNSRLRVLVYDLGGGFLGISSKQFSYNLNVGASYYFKN